jgi:hypothetical protein
VFSGALFATTPSITSLSPASGAIGSSVTITGANFGTTPDTSTVTFNGTAATATGWSAGSIVVSVPTAATTGYVTVTVGGVVSNSVNFMVATANLTLTGSLATARMFQTATLLNGGTVLVAGGVDGFQYLPLSSAELFSPVTGTVTTTGNLNTARIFNTATLLMNGHVLIAGGSNSNWYQIGAAELYDPASGTFTLTGGLNTARTSHTATLLSNGKVLIVGGWDSNGDLITSDAADSELYDPATGTFVASGTLNTGRDTHTATLLNNGKVLIAGGFDSNSNIIDSAELYDPATGTFTPTGNLNIGRAVHTATLLNSGLVLIAEGYDVDFNAVAGAELYDPASGTFTLTGSMNTPRYDGAQGTLLNNGTVLLAGGQDNNGNSLASAELYDPATGIFTVTGSMNSTRQSLTTTLLNNGQVLVAAGMDFYSNVLNSAELYQPSTLIPAGLVSIAVNPGNPSVSVGATQHFTATGTFSDNSTQTLACVTWKSSNGTIGTIANDASNRGNSLAVATGSATVSACTGSLCGSTTMTVTPQLVSIAVTPSSPSVPLNAPQGLQLTATGVYSDGSSRDLTAYATWATSNPSVAAILQSPAVQGVVVPVAAGTANIMATFGRISASTSITVVALPVAPVVSGVSPNSGVAGTQVTISGSGFGAQGSGNVVLGSALGTVVSWSDAQVIATVAHGSVSGIAMVQQGGVESNTLSFTVNNASVASVTPTNGLAGTQVTITGSGFGASQDNGQVTLGTAPGAVTNWSDTQVMATVATGSTSGTAQVLQSGVWSNSVPFTINIPRITSISPTSGAGGALVTITGVSFGSTRGSGSVWIGSTYGTVTNWSNTHVVASVDSSAVSGIVKVSQNGTWSNAVTFTVPPGSGTPVTIMPNVISMVIGDTRSLQALNSSGQPVTGLSWASSDLTIATLSTDDPPIITAVATGNITITAGNASADLTVYPGPVLPTGTIIWSNPGNGSGVKKIIPAVPSSTGVADVFALQTDGTVQAITSDGTVAWTGNAGANSILLPDFQGGLTVVNGSSVKKLDGMTGQPYPAYTLLHPGIPNTVVHTDGTVFIVDGDTVVGVDPLTGTQTFSIPMTHSTSNGSQSQAPPTTGSLMIAGDGYAYIVYQYAVSSGNASASHSELHARLLRVGSDGSSMEIPGGDWSQDRTSTRTGDAYNYETIETQSGYVPSRVQPNLITNADQGVLLSVSAQTPNYYTYLDITYTYVPCPAVPVCGEVGAVVAQNYSLGGLAINLLTVTGGSVTANVTLPGQIQTLQPVLQAQDGTFFGLVDYDWDYADDFLASFDQSGNIKWSIPGYYAQVATADGGVIAQSYSGKSVTFDANGSATGQLASLPIQSWTGRAYRYGSTVQAALIPTNIATTLWAQVGANPSGQSTAARPWSFVLVWQNDFTFTPDYPQVLENLTTNITYDAAAIKQAALQALKDAYSGVPVTVVEGTSGTGDASATILNHQTLTTSTVYGITDPTNKLSQVDYINVMEGGQAPYNVVINNAQDETNALQQRTDYIRAIGRAIGNNAAHEIAHQFLFSCCDMDADPGTDPNAKGTYNAKGSAPIDDPTFWTGYWPNPLIYLHWESPALSGLGQCLGGGWRSFHGSSCHN